MIEPALSKCLKLAVLAATALATGVCFSTQIVSADTLIDDFTAAANNRFTNDPAFVVPDTFSLSGVGRQTTGGGQWATLIGDNAFLTAFHRQPTVGSTIEFYAGNDPNSTPLTANVVSGGSRVDTGEGTTDLYVGYLDRVVDSSIQRYSYARDNFTALEGDPGTVRIAGASPYDADQLGYIVGISQAGNNSIATDQSVGLNQITGYAENVAFQGRTNNDTIVYEYDDEPADPNDPTSPYVNNEAFVQGGDSGAPNFIIRNGELLLLGVNSFQLRGDPITVIDPVTGLPTTSQFLATGVTFTGNVDEEIDRLVSLSSNVLVTPVPEPSSTVILPMVSLLALRRKRN